MKYVKNMRVDHKPHGNLSKALIRDSGWRKTPVGWFKLNTDGACNLKEGFASCRAILRDCNGEWIVGVVNNLRKASDPAVELWGALVGL
ncbi:hypothetical protein L6164_001253 [Bauhinia variegata]|uniref:Uncharacterized protein n=1 Tax=Bauhinia variegata TaxID=167791 RepID=A0ACB9QAC9_BAUVA|nr:hypothetical protein L6164_001253 [Bauhinia variegata]